MKNVSAFLKRHIALLLLVLVLATVPAGIAFGKYVKSVKVTNGISITVEAEKEYIIDKNEMWTALQGLAASNPTELSFVKGSDAAGMQRVDTTGGIQAEGSGEIGVYQSGTVVYIAPVGNNKAEMYAPEISSYLFRKEYTNLALRSISFSNLNTSKVTKMQGMFDNCSSLETLDLSSFNTSSVKTMMMMFRECGSLSTLDLSSFNTGSVGSMAQMFEGCTNLNALDLSNFDTSSVTTMANMFKGCTSLTELNLSSFNTSSVKFMKGVFEDCTSLTALDLSRFDTSSALQMHCMFKGCTSLTELDLSSFNTGKVTQMGEMFSGCKKLKTILVGRDFDATKATNSNNMFSGCTNLVGGNGTPYNSSFTDKKYAHIDGGTKNPGYFTDINAKSTLTVTGSNNAKGISFD